MAHLLVRDGVVVNSIVPPEGDWTPPDGFDLVEGDGKIGDHYDGNAFTTPPDSIAVPLVISRRQFFQALAEQQMIGQDEALAAVRTGDIPREMTAFVDGLPADQKFGAQMLLSGAQAFERYQPMVQAFAASMNMTGEQIDDLWRHGSEL